MGRPLDVVAIADDATAGLGVEHLGVVGVAGLQNGLGVREELLFGVGLGALVELSLLRLSLVGCAAAR